MKGGFGAPVLFSGSYIKPPETSVKKFPAAWVIHLFFLFLSARNRQQKQGEGRAYAHFLHLQYTFLIQFPRAARHPGKHPSLRTFRPNIKDKRDDKKEDHRGKFFAFERYPQHRAVCKPIRQRRQEWPTNTADKKKHKTDPRPAFHPAKNIGQQQERDRNIQRQQANVENFLFRTGIHKIIPFVEDSGKCFA